MATKPKAPKAVAEFVGKAEFESFKNDTSASLTAILNAIEKKSEAKPEPTTVAATKMDMGGGPQALAGDDGYLPPQYQKVFEKYFDTADGFTAKIVFPEVLENGSETGGITFTIVVPMKFSNTIDAYRKMYKVDLRTRALQPHNIAKGIDEWCKAVARNLKYDKKFKTK